MEEEIINLGVFEFDTSRLEASYESATQKVFDLTNTQAKYKEQAKEVTKAIAELQKEQDRLTASGNANSDEFARNRAEMQRLTAARLENFRATQGLTSELTRARAEVRNYSNQLNAFTDAEGRAVTLQERTTELLNRNITSINDARAANSQLLSVRNQLNPAISEELNLIRELNEAYDSNTEYIRSNVSAAEQQKMAIGDYSNQIKEALGDLNIFNGGLTGFVGRAQEAGGVGKLLTTSLAAVRVGLVGVTQAAIAFIFTPVGAVLAAIVAAFLLVKNAMNRSEEATNKINKIFAQLGGILNMLLKALEPLGEFIIDYIVFYFETMGKAAQAAAELVAGALDLLGFDSAAAAVKGYTDEVKASVKAAGELADAEATLEKAQRNARLTQLNYQKEAEKLRQIRDDESKSTAERIKANEDLGKVLDKQLKEELAIARLALDVANKRIEADGKRPELLDKQAEALTEIADIEERITGQQSEQLVNRNSLLKEAAEARKAAEKERQEREKKAAEDRIKDMQLELQIYIESNNKAKSSLDDRLKHSTQIYEKEKQILDRQLKDRLISQKEYNLALLQAQNKYTADSAAATLENLDLELEAVKLNNQRKLDQNQYFNDELYQQELDRINLVGDAERERIKADLDNKIISQQEYNNKALALDQELQGQRDEAFAAREEAQKLKDETDYALRKEIEGERLAIDLDEQLAVFDSGYEARKAAAEKAGADMELFEKAEAERRKNIERAVNDNKLQLASNTLNQIASIFGEESKAAKAAAVAQTTIDTFRASQAAFRGMVETIPGPVGIALGSVAAAAAVATGFANVKKIVATKEPDRPKAKYARGVIGLEGSGTSVSDSIDARLSLGESVINQQGSSMFPNTLSAINAIGNGEAASSNLGVQGALLQDANGGNLSQIIADAVAEGAAIGTAAGSQAGLSNLAENRNIRNNATY